MVLNVKKCISTSPKLFRYLMCIYEVAHASIYRELLDEKSFTPALVSVDVNISKHKQEEGKSER